MYAISTDNNGYLFKSQWYDKAKKKALKFNSVNTFLSKDQQKNKTY